MVMSNRERVSKGLDALKAGLLLFISTMLRGAAVCVVTSSIEKRSLLRRESVTFPPYGVARG